MSDSGFSRFPSTPPSGASGYPPARGDIKAQIVDVSGPLARITQTAKLIAEVIALNKDGTVTLRTDQGDVTVKPREKITLEQGQKIEVEIPPGNPPGTAPRQAAVRPALAPTPQAPPQQSPNPTPEPGASPAAPRPPLNQSGQVNISDQEIPRPDAVTRPPLNSTPRPLPPDAITRLTPLPPDQARQIAQQIENGSLDQVLQTLPSRVTTAATSAAQTAQIAMTRDLMTAFGSLTRESLQPLIQQMNTASISSVQIPGSNTTQTPLQAFMRQIVIPAMTQAPVTSQHAVSLLPPVKTPGTMTLPTPAQISLRPLNPTMIGAPDATISTPTQISTATLTPSPVRQGQFIDTRIQQIITPQIRMTVPGIAPALQTTPLLTQPIHATGTIAQVMGMTAQNLPLIALTLPGADAPQILQMNFPATNLTPGASLVVTPHAGMTLPASSGAAPSVFELMSGFHWPALDEMLDIQAQSLQAATTQALANVLPNPNQPTKIPAAILLFIAAVRSGDLNNWLGEKNIEALRRTGRSEFISRMTREFAGLNRLASEPVTSEWRGMAIPMMGQGEVDKIHLYYRHHDADQDGSDEQASKGRGTRFIMDLNLSAMGDVQLDGYSRGKNLDLAIRTRQSLSMAMRHDMTQRYIATLERSGMQGALVFQSQPEKWVKVALKPDLLSASA